MATAKNTPAKKTTARTAKEKTPTVATKTTKSVPAPSKRTTAPKTRTAAPKPAEKTTAPAKGAADTAAASFEDLVSLIVDTIKSGAVDFAISTIDDAITDRIEVHAKKEAAAAKKKQGSSEKKVPTPVKKEKSVTVAPEVGKTYAIDDSVKTHGGKKGKFLRFYKGDDTKSVMDIGEAKPIVVKTDMLRRSAAARRNKK